jgi:ribonuclease D
VSDFQLIDDPAAWPAVAERLSTAPRLALDLEADGYHRYPERLSLVQVGLPGGEVYLLDPLALADLDALGAILADAAVPKVLHSADYDLRMLDRHRGFHIENLVDTSIAAQFCGARRLGLGNVLAEFLGLELAKPRRLQTLDWSQRPLEADALAYAAGDVAHLFALADTLGAQLAELGRTVWVAEECARLEQVRYVPPDPPEKAFFGTPGARDLSPGALAVLKELYLFREQEALRIGRPPHHVMSNAALITLAGQPKAELAKVVGLGRRTLGGEPRTRLLEAIKRGQRAEPIAWPRRASESYWSSEARQRLTRFKQWRSAEAERLGLDPGVIWPAAHLEQLALHPERDLADLDKGDPAWVRRWQWQELGASLQHYRTANLDDPAATPAGSGPLPSGES